MKTVLRKHFCVQTLGRLLIWRGLLWLLLSLGLMASLWAFRATTTNIWDQWMLAAYAKMQSNTLHSDAILIEIDDKSLQHVGSWPWPRARHADILQALGQPSVIVYDVAFIDETDPINDSALAAAAERQGNVVVPLLAERDPETLFLHTLMPYPALKRVSRLGHIDLPLAANGCLSTVYLKAGNANAQYPLLALAAIAHSETTLPDLKGQRPWRERSTRSGLWVRDYANVLLPYVDLNAVQRYSAVDILRGEVDPVVFEGRPVFIGLTSAQAATAVDVIGASRAMFDVEIQLQAYEALLHGGLLQRGDNSVAVLMALLAWSCVAALLWFNTWGLRILSVVGAGLAVFVAPLWLGYIADYWVLQGFSLLAALLAGAAVLVAWLHVRYGPKLPKRAPLFDDCKPAVNQAFGQAPLEGQFVVLAVKIDFFSRYVTAHRYMQALLSYWRVRQTLLAQLPSLPLAQVEADDYGLLLCLHVHDLAAFNTQISAAVAQVEALKIRHATSTASDFLTVSIGVAAADLALLDQPELLLGNAQVALKQVLAQGRNGVSMFK